MFDTVFFINCTGIIVLYFHRPSHYPSERLKQLVFVAAALVLENWYLLSNQYSPNLIKEEVGNSLALFLPLPHWAGFWWKRLSILLFHFKAFSSQTDTMFLKPCSDCSHASSLTVKKKKRRRKRGSFSAFSNIFFFFFHPSLPGKSGLENVEARRECWQFSSYPPHHSTAATTP